MPAIETAFLDIGRLDRMSRLDSPIHRLDPRAKVLATLAFLVAVVSFPRYEVSALLPFVLFPALLLSRSGIPAGFILKKALLAAPFALMIGIFNPILDREVMIRVAGIGISGGFLSLASIMIRFGLTVTAALILVAATGMRDVCLALERLGLPRAFAVQLLFLHRYLFVLGEEAARMNMARRLRSFDGRGLGFRAYASLLGHLLLRTLDRAQRVHVAMLCRGFTGEIISGRTLSARSADVVFVLSWGAFFLAARHWNLPRLLEILMGRLFA